MHTHETLELGMGAIRKHVQVISEQWCSVTALKRCWIAIQRPDQFQPLDDYCTGMMMLFLHAVFDPCTPTPCDPNAMCERMMMNTSFTCTCIPPFIGDGMTCMRKDSVTI